MKNNKNYIPSRVYREIMANVPICCVDIIFLNKQKNKTLLFKRNNEPVKNIYYATGGRLFKNETFLKCAIRQAKRELGLKINPKDLFFAGIIQDNHKNSIFKGVTYNVVDIFFGYILKKDTDMKFDKQHSEHKWCSIKDSSLHPFIKERLRQTLLKIERGEISNKI